MFEYIIFGFVAGMGMALGLRWRNNINIIVEFFY